MNNNKDCRVGQLTNDEDDDAHNDEDDEPGLGFDKKHIWSDQITPD